MKNLNKFLKSLFKNFFHNIFFLIYGKIDGVTKVESERFTTEKKLLDGVSYNIYEIKKGRLYTDTIHDAAFIIDQKILEGPSFQLRNHKNSSPNSNSVFSIGTPRLKKKINGTVFSLLVGGGGNYNYWHWLLDVLPKLKIIENKIESIDYFIFPNTEKKFQKETIELMNIPINKILSSKQYRHVYADKIISTDFTFNLTNNPAVDHLNIPKWIYSFLKNSFIPKIKDSKVMPKKFYIDRTDTLANSKNQRVILNENLVKKYLLEKNYELIKLAELPFLDQVQLFNKAESIIGLHGAGFANLIFCNPKTKVLELKSNTAGDIVKNLSVDNNLEYQDLSCEPKSINEGNQSGDIVINIDLLKKIINS